MKTRPFSMVVFLILMLPAIVASCSVPKEYVDADRGFYDQIAPDYLKYVAEDPKLDQEQKDRRARMVGAWLFMIDKASGAKP